MSSCRNQYVDRTAEWSRGLEDVQGLSSLVPATPQAEAMPQDCHSYGTTVLNDHVKAHFGNKINIKNVYNGHPGKEPRSQRLENLRDSLRFERMGARSRNVATATATTCEWLFIDQNFQCWINDGRFAEHLGFFWMKGKPGSGKSTIMKKLLAWAEQQWPRHTIIPYFFNARAPDLLEKSALGLYQTLTYHLLLTSSSVRLLFLDTFALKEHKGKVEEWSKVELQEFLIRSLEERRVPPLVILIDALDEGQEDEVQDMVIWLEDFAIRACEVGTPLRICLSSRHYPYITINQGLSLVLENETGHDQDISIYIHKTLRGHDSSSMELLRHTILSRSQGIFLWVVLVVPILNRVYNHGRGVAAMTKKLEDVPQGLHELFSSILSRDADDFGECITLFRWTLYSLDSLKPSHLWAAIQTKHSSPQADDEMSTDKDILERFILNCSRGLVEVSHIFIQFIHQSVKEFLTGKNSKVLSMPIAAKEAEGFSFVADVCHADIGKSYLRYLFHVAEMSPLTLGLLRNYSLAKYAAKYWWQHMKISGDACDQLFVDMACKLLLDPNCLLVWVQLHNVDIPRDKMSITMPRTALASPLSYAAKLGFPRLVAAMLQSKSPALHIQGGMIEEVQLAKVKGNYLRGRPKPLRRPTAAESGTGIAQALRAAAKNGHVDVVRVLIEAGGDPNGAWEGLAEADALPETKLLAVARLLLDTGAGPNVSGTLLVLSRAVALSHTSLAKVLIASGTKVNVDSEDVELPLVQAATLGNEMMTQTLLESGAEPNLRSKKGQVALIEAAQRGRAKVVSLLLEAGADCNIIDRSYGGRTALLAAAEAGHSAVVSLLLNAGADIWSESTARSALTAGLRGYGTQGDIFATVEQLVSHVASQSRKAQIMESAMLSAVKCNDAGRSSKFVRLLLQGGADVNTSTEFGSQAWMEAARNGHVETLRILVDAGAIIDLVDSEGREAFRAAAKDTREDLVLLLLSNASNMPEEEAFYVTLLLKAAEYSWIESMKLLLDRGTDVHAQSPEGLDALMIAAGAGHTTLVALLLAAGADMKSQHKRQGNALQIAIRAGHTEVVELMLTFTDSNADQRPNPNDAFATAAETGQVEAAKLLLNRGADINHKGVFRGGRQSALFAAIFGRKTELVKLLVERGAQIDLAEVRTALLNGQTLQDSRQIEKLLLGIMFCQNCLRKRRLGRCTPQVHRTDSDNDEADNNL